MRKWIGSAPFVVKGQALVAFALPSRRARAIYGCMKRLALGFLAVLALVTPQAALSQNNGPELERPADVEAWSTVGTTVRLDREHGQTPWQMRQVLMAPGDYAHFRRAGEYADGTTFAVLFYPVALAALSRAS